MKEDKDKVIVFKPTELSKIIESNLPQIQEKTDKALAALSVIKKIDSEEADSYAEKLLVKVRSTHKAVEELTFDITRPLQGLIDRANSFKKQIDLSKGSGSEAERVKLLRDAYANEKRVAAEAEAQAIAKKKLEDQEVARVKTEMVKAVEGGIVNKLAKAEDSLSLMFDRITLETGKEASDKIRNIKPKLDEAEFEAFLDLNYNSFLSDAEISEIKTKAIAYFDFEKCRKAYVENANKILDRWIKKLPARKKELEIIANTKDESEKNRLAEEARARAEREAKNRKDDVEKARGAIYSKATEKLQEDVLVAEFDAQVKNQQIETATGTRENKSYRFANEEEVINNPVKVAEILTKVMLHVVTDDSFPGIYQRQKSKFPKVDEQGNKIYLDCINDWFKMLNKIKGSPEIPGLQKTISVSTIAKAK